MLTYIVVGLLAFVAGAASVVLVLWLIEQRVLARPDSRVAVAQRLVAESKADAAWRAWCAAQPQSAVEDDSYLDIHQWGVR